MRILARGNKEIAPTLLRCVWSLPPKAAVLAQARPARRTSKMTGFTLLELLIVVAIIAVATAGVGFALRDTSGRTLAREADRLAALLESARAQSRMSATAVRWHTTATGFAFDGLTGTPLPTAWLGDDVSAPDVGTVLLGPEPILRPQQIRLVSRSQPGRSVTLATDGVRPFAVLADAATSATP
jgi:general secretion pathway protein H